MSCILLLAALLALGIGAPLAPAYSADEFDPAVLDEMAKDVHQVPLPSDKSDLELLPPEKREAMTAVATKHGFKDLQEWSDVAQSVVMSYAYLREGKGLQELDKMVDQMVAQAEADSKLTEEQKQKTIAQVRELGAKLAKLQPLPQNYDLVEKMIGKVAAVMKIQ